jgi:hypothetical protein
LKPRQFSGPAAILLIAALPVAAHHSGAMFDDKTSVTLTGTVRAYQWTNPHCWIQVLVPGEGGGTVEWSVEMGAPIELYRHGWRPTTLRSGDRITVTIHPMRNGVRGGLHVSSNLDDCSGRNSGRDLPASLCRSS